MTEASLGTKGQIPVNRDLIDTISTLYVDDDKHLLDICKIYLERTGTLKVDVALSGTDALAKLATMRYDLVISDYEMPNMNGLELLKIVRANYADLPFIIFTGRGREEIVIEAINCGVDFYLQKGGDAAAQFTELAHKIRQAISRRKAQEELLRVCEQLATSEEELRMQLDQLALSEEQVRESELKYRTLVEVNRDIIFSFDPQGMFRYMSPQTTDQIGYRPDEMVGKVLWNLSTQTTSAD
jgi:DNA-binding response OmpR family regulator